MKAVAVAAQKGNTTALEVFRDRNLYNIVDLRWAAECAINAGQAEALDIIFPQKRFFATTCDRDYKTEAIFERFRANRIAKTAMDTGNAKLLLVAIKYFPYLPKDKDVDAFLKKNGILDVKQRIDELFPN